MPANPTPPPDPLREALEELVDSIRRDADNRDLFYGVDSDIREEIRVSWDGFAILALAKITAALARPAESGRACPDPLCTKPAGHEGLHDIKRLVPPPPPTAYDDARIEREVAKVVDGPIHRILTGTVRGDDMLGVTRALMAAEIAAFARLVRDESAAALRPKATGFDVEAEVRGVRERWQHAMDTDIRTTGPRVHPHDWGIFDGLVRRALQRAREAGREEGRHGN